MVIRSSHFRSNDFFSKPIDGVRTKTTTGGAITLLASISAAILFLSQLYLYFQTDTRHSFFLTQSHPLSLVIPTEGGYSGMFSSTSPDSHKTYKSYHNTNNNANDDDHTFLANNRMTIQIHIVFPHIACADLDYSHDGASHSNGKLKRYYGNTFNRRSPTEHELHRAKTGCSESEARGKDRKVRAGNRGGATGCTIEGTITVPRISGDLTFTVTDQAWQKASRQILQGVQTGEMRTNPNRLRFIGSQYNSTYHIHRITFYDGKSVGPGGSSSSSTASTNTPSSVGYIDPLYDVYGTIDEDMGSMGHTALIATLIPTRVKRFARRSMDIYQTSVSRTVIGPINLATSGLPIRPGLSLQYDFSPLAVHHVESRENVLVFLSGLVGIVGCVFVTVGLVSGCLVEGAKAVSKKMD